MDNMAPKLFSFGFDQAITAVISVATALALIPLIPKAMALGSPAQLLAVNQELERQIEVRAQRERQLTRLTGQLEQRIKGRTGELKPSIYRWKKKSWPAV
jgi:hypothetical protein